MRTIRADLLRHIDPGVGYEDARWDWRRVAVAVICKQGVWATLEYRFRRWARGYPGLRAPLRVVCFISLKLVESLTGISIAWTASFGPGLYIGHFGAIIVGPDVIVGENCNLSQGVTLGDHVGSPRIGDFVHFAPGAKAFGPITIGDHVRIGANAVVNRDLPSGCTAVGVPARVVDQPEPSPTGRRRRSQPAESLPDRS